MSPLVIIRFLIADAYSVGGTIRATFTTAAALAARGHEVEIVSAYRRRERPARAQHPAHLLDPGAHHRQPGLVSPGPSTVRPAEAVVVGEAVAGVVGRVGHDQVDAAVRERAHRLEVVAHDQGVGGAAGRAGVSRVTPHARRVRRPARARDPIDPDALDLP